MIIALYKAKDHLFNRLTAWWTKGPYSHTELIFSNGMSGSSSFRDGGVRVKKVIYKPEKWDFIVLPHGWHEGLAKDWFAIQGGEGYDTMGIVGHVWKPVADDKNKWVCSEAVLAALGYEQSWRFSPNDIAPMLMTTPIQGCDFDFEKYGVHKYVE
jgi:hypothetical protein